MHSVPRTAHLRTRARSARLDAGVPSLAVLRRSLSPARLRARGVRMGGRRRHRSQSRLRSRPTPRAAYTCRSAAPGVVYVYDSARNGNRLLGSIGAGRLQDPSAVAVDNRMTIYVADAARDVIVTFGSFITGAEYRGTDGATGTALGQMRGAAWRWPPIPSRGSTWPSRGNVARAGLRPGARRAGLAVRLRRRRSGALRCRRPGLTFEPAEQLLRQQRGCRQRRAHVRLARRLHRKRDRSGYGVRPGRSRRGPRRRPRRAPVGRRQRQRPRRAVRFGGRRLRAARHARLDRGGRRSVQRSVLARAARPARCFMWPTPPTAASCACATTTTTTTARSTRSTTAAVWPTSTSSTTTATPLGNACDDDDDGDGLPDAADPCPTTNPLIDGNRDGCADPVVSSVSPKSAFELHGRPRPARISGRAKADTVGVAKVLGGGRPPSGRTLRLVERQARPFRRRLVRAAALGSRARHQALAASPCRGERSSAAVTRSAPARCSA